MNEAAYVEVSVIMLKIAHLTGISPIATRLEYIIKRDTLLSQARNISPEDRESERSIPPTLTKNCCALLKRAKAIRALYIAAITGHMDQLHELVTSAIRYDIDVACDALEHMSVVWDVGESDEQDLAKLLDIYIGAHSATSSSSIRTIALRNLADILEHFFQSDWLQRTNIKSSKFPNFELSLLSKGNPDLTNAEIRITGSLLALDFLHYTQQDSFVEIGVQIQAWSDILSGNSKSENVSICCLSPKSAVLNPLTGLRHAICCRSSFAGFLLRLQYENNATITNFIPSTVTSCSIRHLK